MRSHKTPSRLGNSGGTASRSAAPARSVESRPALDPEEHLQRAIRLGHSVARLAASPPPVPPSRVQRLLAVDEPPPKEALGSKATLSIWEALALRGFTEREIAGLQALQRDEGLHRFATWREAAEAGLSLLSRESEEQEEQEEQERLDEDIEIGPELEESPSGGRSLDPEKMFASRIEPEEHVVEVLEEEEEIAEATVELPNLVVEPQLYEETRRQLELQLAALNRLTALDWLSNLLLNRIKTPEQQIQEGYGTKTGRRLARKIDDLLLKDRRLALLLMDAIRRRLAPLVSQVSGEHLKILRAIDQAAQKAAKEEEVYLAFRHLKGLDNLHLLSSAGVLGGIGRQHGEGDERSYRERHSSGIDLLKQSDPQYRKNACLHNPDQCVGGPMEILWQLGERDEVERARSWYQSALRQYQQASYLVESYGRAKPTKSKGEVDQGKIDTASDELSIAEDELEQAAAFYMQQVELHIGNYDVNSLLGQAWMEDLGTEEAINRIDLILQRVLEIPFEQLAQTPLNVVMDVEDPEEPASLVSSSSSFPDVFSSTVSQPSTKRKQSKKVVEKRKDKKLAKVKRERGPQQVTFEDLAFAKKKKRIPPPSDLVTQAEQTSGRTFQKISGAGLNCYIRSLATWLARKGYIPETDIENAVGNLAKQLAELGLRFEREMIDAGGLAAQTVQDLVNHFAGVDVYITIVQWDYGQGNVVTFDANDGTNQVVLLYTPGHFDLLD